MKGNRYFILTFLSIAIGVSLIITGCEETPSSSGSDPVMRATVDGTTWSAGNNVDGTVFSQLKSITGTAGDGSSITLDLENVTSTGSVDIDGGNIKANYIEGSSTYTAPSGTINITELDAQNNISGTFSFEGETGAGNPVSVTSGSFSTTLR